MDEAARPPSRVLDTSDPLRKAIQKRLHIQEIFKMTYESYGDDSTKEDEEATELATLRLLSKC